MSYEIIYDKQFVKVNDKYIAIVLTGSNNCYESGNSGMKDRRERSWYNISHINTGKKLATAKELLDGCDTFRESLIEKNNERTDPYSDDRFGYFTSIAIGSGWCNSTFGRYKGLFNTGIKKALTVEQLAEVGQHVMLYTYYYDKGEIEEVCKKAGRKFLESVTPKTTDELIKAIGEWEDNYDGVNVSWHITFYGGRSMENNMKYIRRKFFPVQKKEPTYVEVKEYYTILAENGAFFHKYTSRGYRYSHSSDKYRFLTKKDAERFIKSKGSRGSGLKTRLIKLDYPVRVKSN